MKSLEQRLELLADAARYDASCAVSVADPRVTRQNELGIYESVGPDGRRLALLKILLTNECVFDCSYCIHRRSSDVERARFSPEEVVALTLDYHRCGLIDGLFLSSGVLDSPDATMEQLIAVARSLRRNHHYFGYIHLKTIPDCSDELVAEAGRWADRLSVNIEMPRQADLDQLAPEKSLVQITRAMNVIRKEIDDAQSDPLPNARPDHLDQHTGRRFRSQRRFAPAGQTTQMIIGATPVTDADVLFAAASLYTRQKLRRIYYSAYIPIENGALSDAPPQIARERRLYQADWLIRDFGFSVGDLTPPGAENLDLAMDPKLAWALQNPDRFPIDVNQAHKGDLLRVPGLGLRSVETILATRRRSRVTLADLAAMRVPLARALPFIVAADHVPRERGSTVVAIPGLRRRWQQLELFGRTADQSA
ncbi:MAG TPA: putative DNA modification/repair radical SAM protein [Gemmatimonadaceae bacterium]|nr:putative DNA modification/repair radical SAM protein [Gemmatimonadaceae bacterium]